MTPERRRPTIRPDGLLVSALGMPAMAILLMGLTAIFAVWPGR